nr:putative ribonuclease H-like domain-containing protein [Tanacetum cinerariifolium]
MAAVPAAQPNTPYLRLLFQQLSQTPPTYGCCSSSSAKHPLPTAAVPAAQPNTPYLRLSFDSQYKTNTLFILAAACRNQTTPSVGFQDKFTTEKAGEEIDQQYVLFPVWSSGSTNPQNNDEDVAFDGYEPDFDAKKPGSEVNVSPSSSAQSRKQDDKTKKEAKANRYRNLSAEFEDFSKDNINEVNAAGTLVPAVEQRSLNNTNTFSAAGPLNAAASPTYGKSSRIDTSKLLDDPDIPELEDITYSDDEDDVGAEVDFNNLETSIRVSPIPTTRVHKDHPMTQIIEEEGINHEEVFALVARIEAIRLFLAYASFMGFMVYQMDVKSAFMYGTIEEEVYVCQPLGFEDPDYPDKVYKVVKALYGLHQAPGACQDKYVAEILRKFGLTDGKSTSTPIDTEKPLLKDPNGVKTPRSDEDRLELMELMVFLLPKVKKVGVEVSAVDLQVSAVRLILLQLVQTFLLFGLTNWCCSLSAVRSSS